MLILIAEWGQDVTHVSGTGHLRCWHRSGGVTNSVWSNPSVIFVSSTQVVFVRIPGYFGASKNPRGVHQRWCGIGVVSSLDGVLLRWRRGVMPWVGPRRCFLVVSSFKIGKFHTPDSLRITFEAYFLLRWQKNSEFFRCYVDFFFCLSL